MKAIELMEGLHAPLHGIVHVRANDGAERDAYRDRVKSFGSTLQITVGSLPAFLALAVTKQCTQRFSTLRASRWRLFASRCRSADWLPAFQPHCDRYTRRRFKGTARGDGMAPPGLRDVHQGQ